jgi:DNA ligase-1
MPADFWFEPAVVLEVSGAEITLSPIHTCGLGEVREGSGFAIRFPRFTGRFRDDKGPEGATTAAEIMAMYNRQLKKVPG